MRKVLHGKKGSMMKTRQVQSDAKDRAWYLNEEMEKAVANLAAVYERYGEAGNLMTDEDKKMDKKACLAVDMASRPLVKALAAQRYAALTCDDAASCMIPDRWCRRG